MSLDEFSSAVGAARFSVSMMVTALGPARSTAAARSCTSLGSITVNGVSLTVNRVSGAEFEINLIPHTLVTTNLKYLKTGSRVNLEVDLVARYIERLQHYGA